MRFHGSDYIDDVVAATQEAFDAAIAFYGANVPDAVTAAMAKFDELLPFPSFGPSRFDLSWGLHVILAAAADAVDSSLQAAFSAAASAAWALAFSVDDDFTPIGGGGQSGGGGASGTWAPSISEPTPQLSNFPVCPPSYLFRITGFVRFGYCYMGGADPGLVMMQLWNAPYIFDITSGLLMFFNTSYGASCKLCEKLRDEESYIHYASEVEYVEDMPVSGLRYVDMSVPSVKGYLFPHWVEGVYDTTWPSWSEPKSYGGHAWFGILTEVEDIKIVSSGSGSGGGILTAIVAAGALLSPNGLFGISVRTKEEDD